MPSWVINELIMQNANETILDQIENLVETGANYFDFSKILPPPPEVEKDPAFLKEWKCYNWNTKWNSSIPKVIREPNRLKYTFYSAWAPPTPVINALSAAFPDQLMEYSYIDENEAWIKHMYKLMNNKLLEETTDVKDNPVYQCEFEDEQGKPVFAVLAEPKDEDTNKNLYLFEPEELDDDDVFRDFYDEDDEDPFCDEP